MAHSNPWKGKPGPKRKPTPGFEAGKPVHSSPMPSVIPPLEAELREVHQLTMPPRGKSWFCTCGKFYDWARSEKAARLSHSYHLDACVEAVERAQRGESNLLDEGVSADAPFHSY